MGKVSSSGTEAPIDEQMKRNERLAN